MSAYRWLFSQQRIRYVHTSPSHPASPAVLVFARFMVAATARIARSIWRRFPEERRLRIRSSLSKNRKYFYGIGGIGIVCGTTYYYNHLEVNPLTNRSRFMMYTRAEICHLMREELLEDGENPNDVDILQKMFGDHILPSDHPHNALAVNIMERVLLANDWCRDMAAGDIKWKIVVVDDNDGIVNALSLPSGDIAVYKGMIDACDNLDELGLIISHEMAHVIMNHGVESISLSSLLSFFSLFVIGFIWFFVPSDILSFILHKFFHNSIEQMTHFRYSRKLELEADQVGLLLASKACFLPVNAIKVWKHLPMFNESNKLQEYFESHPCNERRFFNLEMTLPHADKIYSTTNCETTMKSEMSSFKGIAKKLLTKIITG